MANQVMEKISGIISGLNEKNPYYVICGFLVLLLLADYFLVLQFQIGSINSLSPKIATLTRDIQTTKANIERIPQHKIDLEKLSGQLNKVNHKMRSKEEAPLILESVSRIANKNGVKIEKILPRTSQAEPVLDNDDGQYFSIPVDVEAKSSYHDFARFINQLETEEIFLSILEFSILENHSNAMHHTIQLMISAVVFEKKQDL
jgi:Tfp pilus assembly protein PilO